MAISANKAAAAPRRVCPMDKPAAPSFHFAANAHAAHHSFALGVLARAFWQGT